MLLRLQRQQRVHAGYRGDIRALELRLKGLHRVNHPEQLELRLVQPRLPRRIGEVRHVPLAGVINQHVGTAKARLYRVGKVLHLVFFQHVAAVREDVRAGIFVLQRRVGAGEPVRITAAEGDLRPFAQQQAQRFKANS